MTLIVSKFKKDSPKETREKLCEVDFVLDTTTGCYVAEFEGIDIPGEARMRIGVSCTDQAYFSMALVRDGNNIINMAAALKNYVHAMIHFPSGYYLEIHIERERLQRAET